MCEMDSLDAGVRPRGRGEEAVLRGQGSSKSCARTTKKAATAADDGAGTTSS